MQLRLDDSNHLHYHTAGSGDRTTLLVHGWAVSGRVWDEIVARWPEGAGKLVVVDLRGAGWSSKPRGGYTIDRHAQDIAALIDHLGGADINLVGHSMGGTIAMRVALERPAALRRLVLVSPVPASGVPFRDEDIAFFRSLCGHRGGAEQTLGMMVARRPDPEVFARAVDHMASVALEALLEGFDAWRTANFADRVGNIRTPTVVFGGGAEQPLTPELLKAAVVALIPGARFEELPGVNHYPQLEAPEEFLARLLAAIGDAQPAA